MYRASDRRTWEPNDSRQTPPSDDHKQLPARLLAPGMAFWWHEHKAWYAVVDSTRVPDEHGCFAIELEGDIEVFFQSHEHMVPVSTSGLRGWSSLDAYLQIKRDHERRPVPKSDIEHHELLAYRSLDEASAERTLTYEGEQFDGAEEPSKMHHEAEALGYTWYKKERMLANLRALQEGRR